MAGLDRGLISSPRIRLHGGVEACSTDALPSLLVCWYMVDLVRMLDGGIEQWMNGERSM